MLLGMEYTLMPTPLFVSISLLGPGSEEGLTSTDLIEECTEITLDNCNKLINMQKQLFATHGLCTGKMGFNNHP